uniref:RING-type domain-containing protein n=1 Tax=Strongyloides papillosus TaxID=174720 RepID=A0A0N5B8C1_STREA
MSLKECQWLCCNRCITSHSQIQLYLTVCGHIFCLSCLGLDAKKDKADCPICNSNTHILEINSKLGQNKSIFFKDPENEFKEAQKKINKIRSFQKYHYENNMRTMTVQFRKAAEEAKASDKMKEEYKKRGSQLLMVIKQKDAVLKKKEDEIKNLKNKITQLTQLASMYKEDGRALKERVKQLEIHSQKSKEKLQLTQAKLESKNLKRRVEDNNKFSKQKPVLDVSQVSFNLQKGINQPKGKNTEKSQFQHNRYPSVSKLNPNKNFFTSEDYNVGESYGFPAIDDKTVFNIDNKKPRQCLRPLSTSTQAGVDTPLPIIFEDISAISEIPHFDNSEN